jgi:hypothetical protein
VAQQSGPRIQDVARRAGVAINNLFNVHNNPDLVTERTRLVQQSILGSACLTT